MIDNVHKMAKEIVERKLSLTAFIDNLSINFEQDYGLTTGDLLEYYGVLNLMVEQVRVNIGKNNSDSLVKLERIKKVEIALLGEARDKDLALKQTRKEHSAIANRKKKGFFGKLFGGD